MSVKVRDYLENYGYKVGYDGESGGVLVTDSTGKTKNIGSTGLTLSADGSYYADSADAINSMLKNAGVVGGQGYSSVRNELTKTGNSVGWIDDGTSRLLNVNGRNYNPNDGNFINIGGTLYAKNDYIQSMADIGYKSPYAERIEKGLENISKRRFNYDPENDAELKAAQRAAMEQVQQQLNSQGVLNSSLNALYTQRAAQELIPQYSRMAYDRYLDEEDSAYEYLNALMGLDSQSYGQYTDRLQTDYNNRVLTSNREEAAAAARSQKLYDTIEKIRTTGVVTNEDSLVTGLPAGRVDGDTMARIDAWTASTRLAQLENQLGNESYKYQADIDHANSKELIGIEQANEKELMGIAQANEKELLELKQRYEAYLLGVESQLKMREEQNKSELEISEEKQKRELSDSNEKKAGSKS